jgi:hypothetical protein
VHKIFKRNPSITVDEKKNPLKIGLAYDRRQAPKEGDNWVGVVIRNLPKNSTPSTVVT